jgi:hypothetical protein
VASACFTGRVKEGPKGASSALEGEAGQAAYEEFARTFCLRPGTNFVDFLDQEGVTALKMWLDPRTSSPEARAFIALVLEMQRRGENLWDPEGISIFRQGAEGHGGRPGREEEEALSVLAQVIAKPVQVYYRPTPGADFHVLKFEP